MTERTSHCVDHVPDEGDAQASLAQRRLHERQAQRSQRQAHSAAWRPHTAGGLHGQGGFLSSRPGRIHFSKPTTEQPFDWPAKLWASKALPLEGTGEGTHLQAALSLVPVAAETTTWSSPKSCERARTAGKGHKGVCDKAMSSTPCRASNRCICHHGRKSNYSRLRVHISWHREGLQCQRMAAWCRQQPAARPAHHTAAVRLTALAFLCSATHRLCTSAVHLSFCTVKQAKDFEGCARPECMLLFPAQSVQPHATLSVVGLPRAHQWPNFSALA